MIMLHPLAARVKKPVGIFWSGLFAIKPPSHLSNKENQTWVSEDLLLDNKTELPIPEHTTNKAGHTEIVFPG
jgi:hypothetical protein